MLKENLLNSQRVELFPWEKIVVLDISFGELFHRCTLREWEEFRDFLRSNGISIEPPSWWRFWRH
jgi:hypothetical protein